MVSFSEMMRDHVPSPSDGIGLNFCSVKLAFVYLPGTICDRVSRKFRRGIVLNFNQIISSYFTSIQEFEVVVGNIGRNYVQSTW